MSQAPAHFRGLYLLFTLSGMFPSRSPRERHRYYPHFTGGVNRCMERLRPLARSQSGFAVPALVSKHNSASNLSLHSGHSNWFVSEPVANLSQVHKDLRSKPRLLGRKVLSFLFELNQEPRSAASRVDICEESLPGRETSTKQNSKMERDGVPDIKTLCHAMPEVYCIPALFLI